MPFYLCAIEGQQLRFAKHVKLAGRAGPISTSVLAARPSGGGGWHLPEAILLERLGAANPDLHAVVIDIAPDRPRTQGEALLCRLRDIWGFTHQTWTPILLRLEVVYDDARSEPITPGSYLPLPPVSGELLHEFLYLRGGTTPQPREFTWGRTGQVNGPLLWPEALRYFLAAIRSRPGEFW